MSKAGQDLEIEYVLWEVGQFSWRFMVFTILASWIMLSTVHMTAYVRWGADLGFECNRTTENRGFFYKDLCLNKTLENRLIANALIGTTLGALFGGVTADVIGRLIMYRIWLTFHITASLANIFVESFLAAVLCRFVVCFATPGLCLCSFTLLMDYTTRQTRAIFGGLFFMYACFGHLLIGVVIFCTSEWQNREAIWFLFNELVLFGAAIFLPESARLWMAYDRPKQSWEHIRKLRKIRYRQDIESDHYLTRRERFAMIRQKYLAIWRHWSWMAMLLVLAVPGILMNQVVLGITAEVPLLQQQYLYNILVAAVETCVFIFGIGLFIGVGRKLTTVLMHSSAAICFFVVAFISETNTIALYALLLLGGTFTMVAHCGVYLMTAEIFPTVNRATMLSLIFLAYIGASDLYFPLNIFLTATFPQKSCLISSVICCTFSVIATGCIAILPPTRKRYLMDTFDEALVFQKKNDEYISLHNFKRWFRIGS